jgi:hypothetical protein
LSCIRSLLLLLRLIFESAFVLASFAAFASAASVSLLLHPLLLLLLRLIRRLLLLFNPLLLLLLRLIRLRLFCCASIICCYRWRGISFRHLLL